jgi:hypothetical protein
MTNIMTFLTRLVGKWEGAGINREGQAYVGTLTVEAPVNEAAIIILFQAAGTDGSIYHGETLMIGMQPGGDCVAYSASNNVPGVATFVVTQPAPETILLTLGDLADLSAFREVITLRLETGPEIFHGFAWAMPVEAMQDRSSARLLRVV